MLPDKILFYIAQKKQKALLTMRASSVGFVSKQNYVLYNSNGLKVR